MKNSKENTSILNLYVLRNTFSISIKSHQQNYKTKSINLQLWFNFLITLLKKLKDETWTLIQRLSDSLHYFTVKKMDMMAIYECFKYV